MNLFNKLAAASLLATAITPAFAQEAETQAPPQSQIHNHCLDIVTYEDFGRCFQAMMASQTNVEFVIQTAIMTSGLTQEEMQPVAEQMMTVMTSEECQRAQATTFEVLGNMPNDAQGTDLVSDELKASTGKLMIHTASCLSVQADIIEGVGPHFADAAAAYRQLLADMNDVGNILQGGPIPGIKLPDPAIPAF